MPSDYRDTVPADELVSEPPIRGDAMQRRHRFVLLLCAAALLLAFVLQVRPDQRVEFRWFPGIPLPHTCMSRICFGLECPACGLTRSIVYFAQGDWRASLETHRLGWLFAVTILVQFPYRLFALARKDAFPLGRRLPACFGYALIFLLIANWLFGVSSAAW